MKDSVILGSGNSRYLKSVENFKTLYPTYDDFAAALVAGTLPIDLNGINAAGFQQVGDALGKFNLLKDATAALYGLDATAVPDDVFSLLNTLINAAQERANISAKFEIGSYQGAYDYDVKCSKTIYFSGKPEIVIIVANGTRGLFPGAQGSWASPEGVIVCRGQTTFRTNNEPNDVNVSFSDKSITLGPAKANSILNYNFHTYTYFALCT